MSAHGAQGVAPPLRRLRAPQLRPDTLATAGIVLFRIGLESLWYDEAVTVVYARGPFDAMWRIVSTRDANGTAYYLLMWAWVHLVGTGEGLVRLPSAGFAALTVPIVFLIGRDVAGAAARVGAAPLLMFGSVFIEFGQEARSYAMA